MRRIFFLLAALAACSRSPVGAQRPGRTVAAHDPGGHERVPSAFNPHAGHPPHRSIGRAARRRWRSTGTTPLAGRRRVPSSPMRTSSTASRTPATDKEDAECSVITFGAGQGGSVDENVTRWVKQLEPTSTAVERSTRTVNGMNVTRVEVGGTYTPMAMPTMPASSPRQGYRLVGDIVESPSGLWFFKVTGPDATVKAAGKDLDRLIDSLRPS